MKAKCIEVGESKFLKLGEIYEVVDDVKQYLLIKDKDGGEVLCLKKYFESVKEEGFNAQNTTINIAGINFSCKDMPCMFATKNWNVKEDKMEDVRVVRKLEDLDGLENGTGLYIDSNLDVRVKNKNMLVCYGNDLKGERKENYLEALKSMGFKFEYKPSKVVHEVIKEIKSLDSLTFKEGEFNYFVSWYKGEYHVEAMRETFIIGVNYMTKEQAQKYADELNEIIGVGK